MASQASPAATGSATTRTWPRPVVARLPRWWTRPAPCAREAPAAWQVLTATDSGDLATLHMAPDVDMWFGALQAPTLRLDVTGATASLLDLGQPVGPDDVATLMDVFGQAIVPAGCQAADPIARVDGDLFGSLSRFTCADTLLLLGITVEREGIDQAALFVAVVGNDADAARAEHFWNTLQLGG